MNLGNKDHILCLIYYNYNNIATSLVQQLCRPTSGHTYAICVNPISRMGLQWVHWSTAHSEHMKIIIILLLSQQTNGRALLNLMLVSCPSPSAGYDV